PLVVDRREPLAVEVAPLLEVRDATQHEDGPEHHAGHAAHGDGFMEGNRVPTQLAEHVHDYFSARSLSGVATDATTLGRQILSASFRPDDLSMYLSRTAAYSTGSTLEKYLTGSFCDGLDNSL